MKRMIVNSQGKALVVGGNALVYENGYVQDGLVAFFDGWNKGATADAWTDLISGIVFTNHGATSLVNGWSFDGTDDYMVSDSNSLRLPYSTTTLEIVLEPTDSSPRNQFLFLPKSGVSNVKECGFYTDAYLRLTTQSGKHKALWVPGSNTISCAGESVFLDGVETTYQSGGYFGAASANYLGSGNNAYFFNGKIFCVRVYNRVLTAAEIKRNQKIDQQRYIYPPVQLVQNGDFANGTTGWARHTASTATVQNGILTLTKSSSGGVGAILRQAPTLYTTHLYYMYGDARSNGTDFCVLSFQNTNWAQGGNTSTTAYTGAFFSRIDMIASPAANNNTFTIRVGNSGSSVGAFGYFRNINLIDLTATFGAGNEPDLATCRAIFTEDYYPYYNPNA